MIALDANILLEILENRGQVSAVKQAIAKFESQAEDLAISVLSVADIFYLAEAHKLPVKRVEKLIRAFQIYSITPADISWAFSNWKGKDFEDALQIAAALRENCNCFLTLDKALAKKYGVLMEIRIPALSEHGGRWEQPA